MRKSAIILALVIGFVPVAAFAQVRGGGPVVDNSRPDNGNISSSNSPLDQYLQRKSMQDLTDAQRAAVSRLGPARPAKKNELTVGAPINDNTGVLMANIAQVDPDGVIVAMGMAKVKVPAEAFGHNKAGLLLDMTKAQFQQVVAQAK